MELLKKSEHKANIQIPHFPESAMHPSYEDIKKHQQDVNLLKY